MLKAQIAMKKERLALLVVSLPSDLASHFHGSFQGNLRRHSEALKREGHGEARRTVRST